MKFKPQNNSTLHTSLRNSKKLLIGIGFFADSRIFSSTSSGKTYINYNYLLVFEVCFMKAEYSVIIHYFVVSAICVLTTKVKKSWVSIL